MRQRWLGILAASFPVAAFADGGGPILLIVNGFLFTIGQVWIIAAEFAYLKRRARSVKNIRLLKLVVGFNFVSTLGGALLLPLLWASIFGFAAFIGPWRDSTFGGVLIALGTWVAGDNSPFPWLALTSSTVLFVGTYFATVWIEFRLLLRWQKDNEFGQTRSELLRLSYAMNAISYVGLIALFFLGILTVFK